MKISATPSYIPAVLGRALESPTGTPVALAAGDSSVAVAVPLGWGALQDMEAFGSHLSPYRKYLKVDRRGNALVTALAGGGGDVVKEVYPDLGTVTSEAVDVVAIFGSGVGVLEALQEKDTTKGLLSAAQVGLNAMDLVALHCGSGTFHLLAFVLRTGTACVTAVIDRGRDEAP